MGCWRKSGGRSGGLQGGAGGEWRPGEERKKKRERMMQILSAIDKA